MPVQQWAIVIGAATSVTLALAPWMFKVHAKLAVIATQIADLCDKLEKSADATHELWSYYAQHEARLDTHDVQISYIDDRLRSLQQPGRRSSKE